MVMLKDKNTKKVVRCPNCNKPISAESNYYTDHDTGQVCHEACFITYLKKQGKTDDELKSILEEAHADDSEYNETGPHHCSECGKLIQDSDEHAVHQIMGFGIGDEETEIDNGWICGKCHEKIDREMYGYYQE